MALSPKPFGQHSDIIRRRYFDKLNLNVENPMESRCIVVIDFKRSSPITIPRDSVIISSLLDDFDDGSYHYHKRKPNLCRRSG